MQAGRDDGRPIFREREQTPRLRFGALLRLNQKVHCHRRIADAPALPRGLALFILVGAEFGVPQALGHFLIPLFAHQRECQPQVQIQRADMGRHILRQILLINQQRWHKPPHDDQLSASNRPVSWQDTGRWLLPARLGRRITGGGRWFFRHGFPFLKVLRAIAPLLLPNARDDSSNPNTPVLDEHNGCRRAPPRRENTFVVRHDKPHVLATLFLMKTHFV